MRKNLILLSLFGLLVIALPVSAISLPNPLCPTNPDGTPVNPNNCVRDLPGLITKIINFILTVIGVLATLMFVWAGILFVTSAGNPEKINQAKKAAIYAAIGVAIALAGNGLILVIREVIGAPP